MFKFCPHKYSVADQVIKSDAVFFSQWKKKKRKNSESFWIDILVNIDRSLLALNYLHLSLTHSPAKWVGRINRVRVQQHSHPSSTVCPNSLQQILTER